MIYYRAGSTIIQEGAPGGDMVIVVRGRLVHASREYTVVKMLKYVIMTSLMLQSECVRETR